MSEFFAMGGYAAYVWPAYAVTALVLLGLLIATVKGLRNAETTLKALEQVRPARRRERPARTGNPSAGNSTGTNSEEAAGTTAGASER